MRDPYFTGWRIVHRADAETLKPLCGAKLNMADGWIAQEDGGVFYGEDCKRCSKIEDKLEA